MEKLTAKSGFLIIILVCILFVVFVNQMIYDQWQHRNSNYYPYSDGFVDGWDLNTSRDANVYISSSNVTTILRPADFCESPVFLLIMVCTAPGNLEARKAIRDTWGSEILVSGFMTRVYFLMGETNNSTLQKNLKLESETYNDIIQEKFVDSYNNLTLKSIMMLKLVESTCTNSVRFLMKTDDDMFVHLRPLVQTLSHKNSSEGILIGSLICRAKPIRYSNNKWYAPKYMYAEKLYPHYLSGTGYVMSIDVVTKLYRAALKIPIFHLEDVYITGLLSRAIRLKPRNDPGFTFQKRKLDACAFKNAYTSHRIAPEEMRRQYGMLRSYDLELCKTTNNSKKSDSAISRFISYFSSSSKQNKAKKNTCY